MLSSQTITDIKNASLDLFDNVSHLAVSELTTQDDTQTLSGEEDRFELDEIIKTTPDQYDWEVTIGLTEANGVNINKIGFMQSSGDNDLMLSDLLPEEIEKTELIELNIGYKLTLDVTDNTTSLSEES
jgi:hypothetical protein